MCSVTYSPFNPYHVAEAMKVPQERIEFVRRCVSFMKDTKLQIELGDVTSNGRDASVFQLTINGYSFSLMVGAIHYNHELSADLFRLVGTALYDVHTFHTTDDYDMDWLHEMTALFNYYAVPDNQVTF